MLDFFSLFFTIIIFLAVAVVKTKQEADKPRGKHPTISGEFPGDDDGKDIAIFLEDLRRRKQLAEAADQAAEEARRVIGQQPAVRPYQTPPPPPKPRQMAQPACAVPVANPPALTPPAPNPAQPAPATSGIQVKVLHGSQRAQKHGLAHPVFSTDGLPASDLAKRAIVLQEVLGRPVALREPRRPWA